MNIEREASKNLVLQVFSQSLDSTIDEDDYGKRKNYLQVQKKIEARIGLKYRPPSDKTYYNYIKAIDAGKPFAVKTSTLDMFAFFLKHGDTDVEYELSTDDYGEFMPQYWEQFLKEFKTKHAPASNRKKWTATPYLWLAAGLLMVGIVGCIWWFAGSGSVQKTPLDTLEKREFRNKVVLYPLVAVDEDLSSQITQRIKSTFDTEISDPHFSLRVQHHNGAPANFYEADSIAKHLKADIVVWGSLTSVGQKTTVELRYYSRTDKYDNLLLKGYASDTLKVLSTKEIRRSKIGCLIRLICARHFYNSGDIELAISKYRSCFTCINNPAYLHNILAAAYGNLGNKKMSLKHFLNTVEIEPLNAIAVFGIHQLFRIDANQDPGIFYSNIIRKGLPPMASLPDSLLTYLYFESLIKRHTELFPDDDHLPYKIGLFHTKVTGDLARAKRAFREFLDEFPESDMSHAALGIIYKMQEEFDSSTYHLKEAISLDPNVQTHYHHLGHVYYAKKEYNEALKYYRQGVRMGASNSEILSDMAACHMHLGDDAGAKLFIDSAVEHYQVASIAIRRWVEYEIKTQNARAIDNQLKDFIEMKPNDFEVMMAGFEWHYSLGDTAKSMEYLFHCENLAHDNILCLNELAKTYEKLDLLQKASFFYKLCLKQINRFRGNVHPSLRLKALANLAHTDS